MPLYNPPTSGGPITLETPTGDVDGVNDEFDCSAPPIQVFLRKLLQLEGTDYTVAINTVTFDAGNIPQTGDEIQVLV